MAVHHSAKVFFRRRPRLASAVGVGVLAFIWLWQCQSMDSVRRLLISWNVIVWTYLLLVGWLMVRSTSAQTRENSEQEDPSAVAVLVLLSLTALFSLAAIVVELAAAPGKKCEAGFLEAIWHCERAHHYLIAAVTLFGSWLMLNTIFTFHYAHLYYRAAADARPLRFPDATASNPGYGDFLYFAFTIGVAAQTSDVSVVTSAMRRVVLAHSVLVFIFNVAIIGATVNIASGLLQNKTAAEATAPAQGHETSAALDRNRA